MLKSHAGLVGFNGSEHLITFGRSRRVRLPSFLGLNTVWFHGGASRRFQCMQEQGKAGGFYSRWLEQFEEPKTVSG